MKKIFTLFSFFVLIVLCACGVNSNSNEKMDSPVELTPPIVSEPVITPEPIYSINGKEVSESELSSGYCIELYGQTINTLTTTELMYKQVEIGDEGLSVFWELLPHMNNLKKLSFDRCGTSDEALDELRNAFPQANISWRIFFGPFSCMTDVEKIWASCDLRNETCGSLKYCHNVKYLDIGHNAMTDLSFLYEMPNLEVLIISCSDFDDITPVASCKNLEFLEVVQTHVSDVSPIASCEKLEQLNVGQNINITDLSPLYNLKNLKRFYATDIYNYSIDWQKEMEKVQEIMPDTEVDFNWYGDALNGSKWKFSRGHGEGSYTERYALLREQFGYDDPFGQTRLYE